MINEVQKMNWKSVDKAREKERKEAKNRANDIRDRMKVLYDIDVTPSENIRPKEKKDRSQRAGSKSDVHSYGKWSSHPRRTSK